MLHGLLHQHLDDALLLADVEGHLAHLTGEKLAQEEKQRRQHEQRPRQTGIHRLHQRESTYQLEGGNCHVGNECGGGIAHHFNILLKS